MPKFKECHNLCNHCYKSMWSFTHIFLSNNNTWSIVSKMIEHRLFILIKNSNNKLLAKLSILFSF